MSGGLNGLIIINILETQSNVRQLPKPFEGVQVKIPYDTGMDPYSGLVDLFEKKGLLVQTGNRLKYIDKSGKEHIDFRKAWTGDKLDMIMANFKESTETKAKKINTEEEETEE